MGSELVFDSGYEVRGPRINEYDESKKVSTSTRGVQCTTMGLEEVGHEYGVRGVENTVGRRV